MRRFTDFWVLDFEASGLCLNNSYPIECGYTNGTTDYEFLIKPEPDWRHWNEDSQGIHGIPRGILESSGENAHIVATQLNKNLEGQNVYCDGGMHDEFWKNRLFEAACLKPTFKLINVSTIELKETSSHRALADAKDIWNYLSQLES